MRTYRVSLSMDFHPDQDLIADGMTEEDMIDYFKDTFLDDIADGIMRNTITVELVDVDIIDAYE